MTRLQKTLALLICAITLSALATEWPPLPKQGFIAGRAATSADVKAGNAVFSAEYDGKVIGKPLKIVIPQYAYYTRGSKKIPVIIVQAEEAQGLQIIGARYADGKPVTDVISAFEFLGAVPPGN